MNRRNFIQSLLTAGASFTILPGAGRLWKAERAIIPAINPAWVDAPYEVGFVMSGSQLGEWMELLKRSRKFPVGAGNVFMEINDKG